MSAHRTATVTGKISSESKGY
uniref:Uncharacterized protein n=1 Tax=Arundo donax TaxID=35708 RepID=A0A0A9FT07_ARUDO